MGKMERVELRRMEKRNVTRERRDGVVRSGGKAPFYRALDGGILFLLWDSVGQSPSPFTRLVLVPMAKEQQATGDSSEESALVLGQKSFVERGRS